jgi:hypothetical protein
MMVTDPPRFGPSGGVDDVAAVGSGVGLGARVHATSAISQTKLNDNKRDVTFIARILICARAITIKV